MRVELRRVWPTDATGDRAWSVALAVAPGGAWLATGEEDGTVRLWHAATGRPFATLVGHRGPVNAVAVAADGAWLATAGEDRTVRRWDVLTGTERGRMTGHRDAVHALAVAADGRVVATGGADRTVRLWDVATGRLSTTLTGHADVVTDLAISVDGRRIVTTSEDNTVRLWHVGLNDPQWIGGAPGRGGRAGDFSAALASVSLARDGTWLATGGYDHAVRLWTVGAEAAPVVLTGHHDTVTSVAIGPDDGRLASVSDDGTLRVWDVATGTEVGRADAGCPLEAVRWGPDGRSLFVAGADGPARYDIRV